MTTASFTVRGGDYEHVQKVAGHHGNFSFGYEVVDANELFAKMLTTRPYEVCEFSLANYLTLRAKGEDWLTAIPVFPNRSFRHGTLVTRRDSPLVSPAQLQGMRIGVEDYSMSAAVWVRGLLHDEYGVDPYAITWVSGSSQRFPAPPRVRLEANDTDIETLLIEGKVDAIVGFAPRDFKRPSHQRVLRTILHDPVATELAYFERTGIYPINHCVIVRNDTQRSHPALLGTVAQAYVDAKKDAYRRRVGSTLVPWAKTHWDRTFEVFHGDPLPYGLTPANRLAIARLATYLQHQGFIDSTPDIDALFAVPDCLAA